MKPNCNAPIALLLQLVTSRFHIVMVCLLAGSSLLGGCTGSQKIRGSMADVDVSGWDVLGEIEVQFPWSIWDALRTDDGVGEELTQSYTIQVADRTTRYQKFRVVVHNWAARITELEVVLDGGEIWEPDVKGVYYKDSASDVVDIPGEGRAIEEIYVEFWTQGSIADKSRFVYFWGKRQD